MKILFMGTPDFAVASLDALIKNNYNVVAVVTATDKYGGRGGKQLLQSPVKKYALSNNIPVLQPEKLRAPDFISALKALDADVFVVVAFRMLPEIVWSMPRLGTYNVHASLLPKYRGAAPINWAIINGETETGVTTFRLSHEIDTGMIALQKSIPIDYEDNAGTLHDKLMQLGAELLLETLENLRNNNLQLLPQPEDTVCYAPKIHHEMCKINFGQNAESVYNFIRGMSPHPGAFTIIDSRELKILAARGILDPFVSHEPGEIQTDNKTYLRIACANGWIDVLEVKQEGKRQMNVKEWLNGYKVQELTAV